MKESSASQNDILLQLVDLISASTKDVISEYEKIGLSVPSLDSTEAGPFDRPSDASLRLTSAIRVIEAACAQLCFAVASPGHTITNKAYGFYEPATLRVVVESNIAGLLHSKPDGLHISEIAKKTGLEESKISRILRCLATKHVFHEVQPNIFANNRLSVKLIKSDPVAQLVGHMTNEAAKGAAFLYESLVDPVSGPSFLPEHTSFQKYHGASFFGYFETPVGKLNIDRFAQAMIGWGEVTGKGGLVKVYPWNEKPSGTLVCDVGGGNGHVTLELLQTYPHLKVVIQDLPPVITQAIELWTKSLPEAVESKTVEFVSMDFFKDAPLGDCDVYYIRHVLHDWPETQSITILKNVRKAMKPSCRVLINEFVLQHVSRDTSVGHSTIEAPEPLLANFGMGRARLYNQDINMMNVLNSKERTLAEFVRLGEAASLKFEKVWDCGEASIIEMSPA